MSQAEAGFRLLDRRDALVQLLLAREFFRCKRRGAGLLLLCEHQIGLGDADSLRRDVHLLLADSHIDIGLIGSRGGGIGLGLFKSSCELRAAQDGDHVAFPDLISRFHVHGRETAACLRRKPDFGLMHDAQQGR